MADAHSSRLRTGTGRWFVVLALAATAVGIDSSPVAAAEPGAEQGADAEAQALELFERSEALYREGDFEQAAALLERAYQLHPEPTLLYNLARAREGQGELVAAADAYERYLAAAADAPDRGAIEQRILSLRAREKERLELEQQQQRAEQRLAELEQRQAAKPKADDDGSVLAGPFPWILLGVGVTGVGVGIGLGVAAGAKHDAAVEEPVQTAAIDEQERAEALALGANVAIVAGSAVGVLGGVLGIVGLASSGSDAPSAAAATWRLRYGPGFIGVDGVF